MDPSDLNSSPRRDSINCAVFHSINSRSAITERRSAAEVSTAISSNSISRYGPFRSEFVAQARFHKLRRLPFHQFAFGHYRAAFSGGSFHGHFFQFDFAVWTLPI